MGTAAGWLDFCPQPRPLAGGDQYNVFLSYRSVNRPWVLNLYDVLKQQGFKVFLDQYILKGGDSLTSVLEDGLQQSQAGVLIWSSATADSKWVRREYETLERYATDKPGFHFVPVKLDSSPLPTFATSRVYHDFSSYPDGPNGGELLRLVHAIVGLPLSDAAVKFAAEQDEAAMIAQAKIKAALINRNKARIIALFEEGGLAWDSSSALGCLAAEGLTKLGDNEAAIRVLETLRKKFPRSIRPVQLHALALARRKQSGDLDTAQEMLGELYARNERDPETVGIYARTWMDRFELSGDRADLEQSRDLYAEAFGHSPDDYYTGINAASKSVLIGTEEDLQRGAEYAAKVQTLVGVEPVPGDYWKTATAAEVQLLQKNYAAAAKLYDAAVDMSRGHRGSHESTWKQACRLMAKLNPPESDRAAIRKVFAHLPDC